MESSFIQEIESSNKIMLDGDYEHALLNLAWLETDAGKHLIFSYVELFPAELETPVNGPISQYKSNFGIVYYVRLYLAAEVAIKWYEDSITSKCVFPVDVESTVTKGDKLVLEELVSTTVWPSLISSNSFPFLGSTWGTVRSHQLISNGIPGVLQGILSNSELLRFLSDCFLFDFLEYVEYLGSIVLVAPDPVLRSLNCNLAPSDHCEYVDFNFTARAKKDLVGLSITVTEHRASGVQSQQTIPIRRNYMRIKYTGQVDEIAYVVTCEERGILIDSPKASFIRTIGLSTGIKGRAKEITIPSPHKSKVPDKTYKVPMNDEKQFSKSRIGKKQPINASNIINTAGSERKKRILAKQLGQKWFYGEQAEAEIFVRNIVSSAKDRVWIIDPYFATIELFKYAMATTRSEMQVMIVTSAGVLGQADKVVAGKKAGDVISDHKNNLNKQHESKIEIKVMVGKMAIHDRFLVVDDEVWLSGNSLNNIGERAGMMIRLPNGGAVITELTKLIESDRIVNLDSWLRVSNTK